MSNFKDPLDAIIAKHEAAAKGEAVEKTDETVVPQVPVPPVPDKIILPTGEPIPTPETKAPIEIDYGDDDQDAEIAAEEAERDASVDAVAKLREKRLNQMNGLLWISGAIIFHIARNPAESAGLGCGIHGYRWCSCCLLPHPGHCQLQEMTQLKPAQERPEDEIVHSCRAA